LLITRGKLVCVDFLRPRPRRPGGLRFLFHCGTVSDRQLRAIKLQESEIDEHRFAGLEDAKALLSGPVARRVQAAVGAKRCLYLEDGRPVGGIRR